MSATSKALMIAPKARCRGIVYSAESILDWRHCVQKRGLDEYGYCWQHRDQGEYERANSKSKGD